MKDRDRNRPAERKGGPTAARLLQALALSALLAGAGFPEYAQAGSRFHFTARPLRVDSGRHDGAGTAPREAFSTQVSAPGAAIVRVHFEAVDLGARSYVTIRSVKDSDEQRLDARSLKEWGMTSGLFNGDQVVVTLHAAPEDRDVSFRLGGVLFAEPYGTESICGTDDRVASSDNRVGRMTGGCTAWRIGNGAMVAAGHCIDRDPDDLGPMLPDGVIDWATGWVEFNVPPSQADGTPVVASQNDQYPIIVSSIQWRHDGVGVGYGKDWAVFRVGANANTGLRPHQAYGAPFRITRELPATNAILRNTGFGVDFGPANEANQTATGPFLREAATGPDIWLEFVIDTREGSSGSPLIWEDNGLAIGMVTNSDCSIGGFNVGTSLEVDVLEAAINDAPGPSTTYVDNGHPLVPLFEGTLMRPWGAFLDGLNAAVNGGRLSVFAGTYGVPAGWSTAKPITIEAPVGAVTIAP